MRIIQSIIQYESICIKAEVQDQNKVRPDRPKRPVSAYAQAFLLSPCVDIRTLLYFSTIPDYLLSDTRQPPSHSCGNFLNI